MYHKRNGKLPRAIVIYRDGVSEGEYAQVDQEEIKKIESRDIHYLPSPFLTTCHLEYLAGAFKVPPQLVFVVVGKRYVTF